MIGKIIKLTGGFYYIKSGDKIFETRARGNFRHSKVEPIVGDDVEFKQEEKTLGYIEKVYPRKNMLTRPKVSNVDLALIVIPVMDPKYNLVIIDKTIIQAEYEGIDVAIVVNKSDLDEESAKELAKIYKNSGFDTFMISDKDDSIKSLREYLRGKTVALCGVSGAGKSTITSRILDKDVEIGKVSEKTKRGKHTTRHTEILYNEDIYIFDTPGFSSLSLKISEDDLKNYFREFKNFTSCKFNNCNHIKEPKCAVKDAVDKGEIEKSRYENYLYIYNELKEKGEY
ncbi:MAG: ribosome small subunit-dependent GTPase A [Peptoniphilus sp.]|uniref:ribosome small subunit-dependent GTPase A n=1 Tax=Peptoniphilus sp. TaxID=1971214 RepID=UPI0025FBB69C|nr:ribosome small subunit-dependent GTPase A [Peptoniphilus sp.]MCI5643059.1 ribosome small subunit-dependent GTPase A [Peptoniphilus sp.]MDD7352148.1 ribosome small subunit-dependent GTPase A [Peptoniphilaceae bacterium]MDY3902808.1 ribosome small subunit-dependent GTPase A [Peptoniphilus sp.]